MKRTFLVAPLAVIAAISSAVEPDYSTAITAAKTSLQGQLETNAGSIFGVMALVVGISLVMKFVRRAAR